MNKNKCLYEAPHTDILVIRFESALLQASINGVNSTNHTEYLFSEEDGGDLS